MSYIKPPKFQAAFTLLELILVVIILGIISSYTVSKFSSSGGYKQDTIIEKIISAGHLTQQLSMNDSERSFSLSIQPNQINIIVDGSSFTAAGVEFPLVFDSSVTLSPSTTITFDHFGETSFATINILLETTENICFETSGWIHQC
jgi:MSHA pilin protein MshC